MDALLWRSDRQLYILRSRIIPFDKESRIAAADGPGLFGYRLQYCSAPPCPSSPLKGTLPMPVGRECPVIKPEAVPTPYLEINEELQTLHRGACEVLGSRVVGMYLYGSLAYGDFALERSDIDFVIVTNDEVTGEAVPALEAMHARQTASGTVWAKRLEGSYISQPALRRYEPTDGMRAHINRGNFYLGHHGSEWIIHRHVLREQGVVVAGPCPAGLIDPMPDTELRRSVLGILREWWEPIVQNPVRLRSGEYQAYAIMTMCRALYTLRHGVVATKPVSARWARGELGEEWAPLIDSALAWRHNMPLDRMSETLDFMRFMLGHCLSDERLTSSHAFPADLIVPPQVRRRPV